MKHRFGTYKCEDCGAVHQYPVYCGNRFCVICGTGRLMQIRKKIREQLDKARKQSSIRISALTLTIPNMWDLKQGIKDLTAAFDRLKRTRFWKEHVRGGVRIMEVTQGVKGDWHPHLHLIIQAKYIDPIQLNYWWGKSRKMKEVKNDGGTKIREVVDEAAIRYVTSYLSKPGFAEKHMDYVNACIKGLKMFSSFGAFRMLIKHRIRTEHVCKDCGGVRLVFSKHFDYIEMPDLRGISPPLDRSQFKGIEPCLVDIIEYRVAEVQGFMEKKAKKYEEIRRGTYKRLDKRPVLVL